MILLKNIPNNSILIDPLATLVKKDKCLCLVLFHIEEIQKNNVNMKSIVIRELNNCCFTGRAIEIISEKENEYFNNGKFIKDLIH